MKKSYPRLLIRKREGMWQLCLIKKPITSMLDRPYVLHEFMYRCDARDHAARLIGKPIRLKKTLRKS